MKATNAMRPVRPLRLSIELVGILVLATLFGLVLTGVIQLPVNTVSEPIAVQQPAEPISDPTFPDYSEQFAQINNELSLVKADYAETLAELEAARAEITELQNTEPNTAGPPDVSALLAQQTALEQRITELEAELESHMNSGGLTRLGKQVDEIAKAMGWKPEIVPCASFGPYEERILTTGKTFMYYQANDWEHSTCFVNFSGWDESKLGSGFYVAVKFEWRFSRGCSWEPNSTYINIVDPKDAPFDVYAIKPEHLGNPDPQALIEKLIGKGLTVYDFQDRGTFCTQDRLGLGAYQVILRLYPVDFNDVIKIMDSGYVSANGNTDY